MIDPLPIMKLICALLLASTAHGCLMHLAPKGTGNIVSHGAIEKRNVTRPVKTKTALLNVRVFDGYTFQDPSNVIIDGDVISDDSTNVDSAIDGLGRYLIPGLIDAHNHAASITHLHELSSFGVTTAFIQNCGDYEACASLHDQVGLTDYYSAGFAAMGLNGTHVRGLNIPPALAITSVEQAPVRVAEAFGNGSDWYKIVAEAGGTSQEIQNALVQATHALGKKTTTHAFDLASLDQALKSQTDSIQHLPSDGLIDAATIGEMVSQGHFVTPTLNVFKVLLASQRGEEVFSLNSTNTTYAHVQANLMAVQKAGIPILAGTDAFDNLPGVYCPYGLTLHWELEYLVEAGFTPAEALRAATSTPALLYNMTDRGVIAPGKRADLLLLDNDPLVNITNTRQISRVWMAGIEYTSINATVRG